MRRENATVRRRERESEGLTVRETMQVGERPSYKGTRLIESRDCLIDMVSTYTLKRVRREKKATKRRRERERARD